MAFTLAQFRTAIKTLGLGGRVDVTDAIVDLYINMAQERICRTHDWKELRATSDITLSSTGTAAADKIIDPTALLGSTFRGIKNMVLEDASESYPIEFLPLKQFDELVPLPEDFSRGHPHLATLWNDTELVFDRPPDADYTVRVRWYKWPTALSADGNTSDLDRKDDLIVHLTLSFIQSLFRVEDSLKHFGIYQNLLREAVGEETRNPEITVIRPNFLVHGRSAPSDEYWRNPWYKG